MTTENEEGEVTFIFVRHGRTVTNDEKLIIGQIRGEIPLNATGREQVEKAALRLKSHRITAAVASDLERAIETARIILRTNDHFDFVNDDLSMEKWPLLRERFFGVFEGKPHAEFMAKAEEERGLNCFKSAWLYDPEGGETIDDLNNRAMECVEELISHAAKLRNNGQVGAPPTILVASHGGFLKHLMIYLAKEKNCSMPGEYNTLQSNTAISIIKMNNQQKMKCVLLYCDEHLK